MESNQQQYFEQVKDTFNQLQPIANQLNKLLIDGKKFMTNEQIEELEKSGADMNKVQTDLSNLSGILNNIRK
jgi:deoxyadenosine/deoxycytidine kinase